MRQQRAGAWHQAASGRGAAGLPPRRMPSWGPPCQVCAASCAHHGTRQLVAVMQQGCRRGGCQAGRQPAGPKLHQVHAALLQVSNDTLCVQRAAAGHQDNDKRRQGTEATTPVQHKASVQPVQVHTQHGQEHDLPPPQGVSFPARCQPQTQSARRCALRARQMEGRTVVMQDSCCLQQRWRMRTARHQAGCSTDSRGHDGLLAMPAMACRQRQSGTMDQLVTAVRCPTSASHIQIAKYGTPESELFGLRTAMDQACQSCPQITCMHRG
jgi:hypothetical protein